MKKLLMVGALACQCLAQKAQAYFHLDFAVKEIEAGKQVSNRVYSTSVERGASCTIRTGDKVPIRDTAGHTTYVDVGVNIDCNSLIVTDGQVTMHVTADVSSAAPDARTGPPLIHQIKWSSVAILPINKPTVIFSSDGATGKHQTQLELTVTPIP